MSRPSESPMRDEMEWNAIHHDLHLAVLAGVRRVFTVVFAATHPAAHCILHLRWEDMGTNQSKSQRLKFKSKSMEYTVLFRI